MRIVGITEGSPAEQCNTLKIGDIIVKANDKVIPKSLPLAKCFAQDFISLMITSAGIRFKKKYAIARDF